jgi:hypothetical protein
MAAKDEFVATVVTSALPPSLPSLIKSKVFSWLTGSWDLSLELMATVLSTLIPIEAVKTLLLPNI